MSLKDEMLNDWKCPNCGEWNFEDDILCMCGEPRDSY